MITKIQNNESFKIIFRSNKLTSNMTSFDKNKGSKIQKRHKMTFEILEYTRFSDKDRYKNQTFLLVRSVGEKPSNRTYI